MFIHAASYRAPHRAGLDSAWRERTGKHRPLPGRKHTHAGVLTGTRTRGLQPPRREPRYAGARQWWIKPGETDQSIQLQTDQGMGKAGKGGGRKTWEEEAPRLLPTTARNTLPGTVATKGRGSGEMAVVKRYRRDLRCCVWEREGCEVLFSAPFFFISEAKCFLTGRLPGRHLGVYERRKTQDSDE